MANATRDDLIQCPQCGRRIRQSFVYCNHCRYKLPKAIPISPAAAPAAAAVQKGREALNRWIAAIVWGGYAAGAVTMLNVVVLLAALGLGWARQQTSQPGVFILLCLALLLAILGIGLPLSILPAIIGAAAGGLAGMGIGLTSLLVYGLARRLEPLRIFLVYFTAFFIMAFCYGQVTVYREFIQQLELVRWMDSANFMLCGLTGIAMAWGFITQRQSLVIEESANTWDTTRKILGLPWKNLRWAGSFFEDTFNFERELEHYSHPLSTERSQEELLADLDQANRAQDFQKSQAIIKLIQQKRK